MWNLALHKLVEIQQFCQFAKFELSYAKQQKSHEIRCTWQSRRCRGARFSSAWNGSLFWGCRTQLDTSQKQPCRRLPQRQLLRSAYVGFLAPKKTWIKAALSNPKGLIPNSPEPPQAPARQCWLPWRRARGMGRKAFAGIYICKKYTVVIVI